MGFRTLGATARAGRELSRIRLGLRTGDPATIKAGATGLIQAVGALPPDHEVRQVSLDTVHTEIRQICDSGSDHQLDGAVLASQCAVAAAPTSDGGLRARLLVDLALVLVTRFERSGSPADLVAMVDARSEAADVVPATDPVRGQILQIAASGRLMRFQHLQAPADLDAAIEGGLAALEAGPADRAMALSNLGLSLRLRYDLTGDLTDLASAVHYGEQATELPAADEPRSAVCLLNYGGSLLSRFERLGDEHDLATALAVSEQAVAAASRSPQYMAAALSTRSLAVRFEAARTMSAADIDAAVDAARQAVDRLADPGARASIGADCISNLALCLLLRYETVSSLDDLDEAIELSRQAAGLAPGSTGAKYLTNYGSFLLRRFQRLGDLADLSAGVEASQTSVDQVPPHSPVRVRCLGNLANALVALFQRTGATADLDRAVAVSRAALEASAPDDANRRSYLNGLAGILVLRPGGASIDELDEAAELSTQAVASAPPGSAEQAMCLASQCLVMLMKYAHTAGPGDLDAAVDAARRAVEITPAEHQFRALFLGRLQVALLVRLAARPSQEDQAAAEAAGREAAGIKTAPPSIRAAGAAMWGNAAAGAEDWTGAIQAYQLAVELLGQVAPRGLNRADQEYELAQIGGLGSRAAACCLRAGDADLAVQLLDHGRGVLLGQALDERTDITALQRERPDLAARFTGLREQLDVADLPAHADAGPGHSSELAASDAASRQAERARDVAEAFEGLLAEVRDIPGFERFLLPPTADDLLSLSDQGPIAMITVDPIRSDALLLTSAGLRVVPLPDLSPAAVAEQTIEFLSALNDIRVAAPDPADAAEARLTTVLAWLWDTVAGPVLGDLGLAGVPGDDRPWPRIWWCPSGLLSFLPLHAAGHHDTRFESEPQTVLDRVVSSYTATAKALLHARGQAAPTALPSPAGQVLVVAMEHTPGAPDLLAAPAEASLLTGLFGARALVLHDEADAKLATATSVLAAMPEYPWAHFACHAATVLRDPSASHLLLDDHESTPLTVLDIARQHLRGAELAFLSACSTATSDGTLPDEAINLASAFQLAGYRRVVATLWPVDDDEAAGLARQFYTELASAADAPGSSEAARVLHDTTRLYRNLYAHQPSMWAAHIHAGL